MQVFQVSDPHEAEVSDPLGMSEEATPTLPEEILSIIIWHTLDLDMSMIGTFNRVSPLFRELTS